MTSENSRGDGRGVNNTYESTVRDDSEDWLLRMEINKGQSLDDPAHYLLLDAVKEVFLAPLMEEKSAAGTWDRR